MAANEKLIEKFKTPQWRAIIASLLVFAFLILWTQYFAENNQVLYNISYSKFVEQLDAGNIKSVTIKKLVVIGVLNKDIQLALPGEVKAVTVRNFRTFLPSFQGEALINKLADKHVIITVEPEEERSLLGQIIIGILPWALIIGVWFFLMRRTQQQIQGGPGGVFSFGASKARLFDVKKPGITFRDVAGMDKVKNELMETVEFLKDPSRYASIGAKVPKGVLLVGPPGTGKTLLARATAGEAGVPFFSISASEFIEMFVGVGASRVRDLFKRARDTKPSIVFIDEIDSIGRTRGPGLGGGHDERA